MILEFSVTNYKSIKDKATISFEATNDQTNIESHCIQKGKKNLLKLAMIIGSNASGKTNILKALDFFMSYIVDSFASLNPNENTGTIPFIFSTEDKKKPTDFEILFFIDEIKYEYKLSLTTKKILYEELKYSPKGQNKLLYARNNKSTDDSYTWGDSLTGNKSEISAMTVANIPFLTAAAKLNHPMLKDVYDWFSTKWIQIILPASQQSLSRFTSTIILENNDMKLKVLDLLKAADLSHISDINVQKKDIDPSIFSYFSDLGKKELLEESGTSILEVNLKHKYNKTDSTLPMQNESRGTQRFYELCGPLLLLLEKGGVLAIDELDTSLHQEIFHFFIKTFLQNSTEAQILFTCHNIDILDTDLLRRDEMWLCEKDDNTGGSKYNCVSDFKGIRRDISLRKSYLSGRLGAKPITDIAYLD